MELLTALPSREFNFIDLMKYTVKQISIRDQKLQQLLFHHLLLKKH